MVRSAKAIPSVTGVARSAKGQANAAAAKAKLKTPKTKVAKKGRA